MTTSYQTIRPLALALLKNSSGRFLFHRAEDRSKKETFYRPLGGGIEFFEHGTKALQRELLEELNQKVAVSELVATFENIFTFEGHRGHEIVLLFAAEFADPLAYNQKEFNIVEGDRVVGQAVWRTVAEIEAEGAKLYPQGIDKWMKSSVENF